MLKTIIGRYALFSVLGIEILVLPYFLSKEVYGEVEFLKYTAFLAQFAFFGAGTGYIVRYLKDSSREATSVFIIGASLHAFLIGLVVLLVLKSLIIAALSVLALLALLFESVIKVREKYLLAMSFKPVLSISFIMLLPLLLFLNWNIQSYVFIAFLTAILVYSLIVYSFFRSFKVSNYGQLTKPVRKYIKIYGQNIKSGFILNISTAMIFLFFYIDRALVRDRFPSLLGDYSLSFSITQLTVVAITTYSYVNLVEFGKKQADKAQFKKVVYNSLARCFTFYIVIGLCSIAFAYGAEEFYKYDAVFETTLLMVGLFGFANVLGSLNAAHLYLGSINILSAIVLVTFSISISLNLVIPLETRYDYYFLLFKTYGLFLLFSIVSFSLIWYKLLKKSNESSVKV